MKKLQNILNDDSFSFNEIIQKVLSLTELEKNIKSYLPPEIKNHCELVNFRSNVLVLGAKNSSSLMKLRYLIPTLLSELRKRMPELRAIECILQPPDAIIENAPIHRPLLSEKTRLLLRELANELPDKKLSSAIKNLSR